MRTTLAIAIGVMLGGVGTASAQAPGASDGDAPPMSQPPPEGPPGSYEPPPSRAYVPPAYNYQRTVVITAEESELLNEGVMPVGKYVAGGITAVAAGFGIGHIVQGRWLDKGWIFTLGESASIVAIATGAAQAIDSCYNTYDTPCQNSRHRNDGMGLMMGGLLAFTGLHIWEIVDAWVAPPRHNKRIHEIRARLGQEPIELSRAAPYVAPVHGSTGGGGVAGLAFRF
jgi:hypothetical protein